MLGPWCNLVDPTTTPLEIHSRPSPRVDQPPSVPLCVSPRQPLHPKPSPSWDDNKGGLRLAVGSRKSHSAEVPGFLPSLNPSGGSGRHEGGGEESGHLSFCTSCACGQGCAALPPASTTAQWQPPSPGQWVGCWGFFQLEPVAPRLMLCWLSAPAPGPVFRHSEEHSHRLS